MEFSAELFDLCNDDLQRLYPSLIDYVRISIYDIAPTILSMFDKNLSDYAMRHFKRDGIAIKTSHHILELRKGLPGIPEDARDPVGFTLKTKEDGERGVGMCVWSTGTSSSLLYIQSLATPGGPRCAVTVDLCPSTWPLAASFEPRGHGSICTP